jgi:hypothetical protein
MGALSRTNIKLKCHTTVHGPSDSVPTENAKVYDTKGESTVQTEGDVTHRRRVAMIANHTEDEKEKENALRIGRDAPSARRRPTLNT